MSLLDGPIHKRVLEEIWPKDPASPAQLDAFRSLTLARLAAAELFDRWQEDERISFFKKLKLRRVARRSADSFRILEVEVLRQKWEPRND